jgi:nucleotide-binding universal stress UspA family protein
MIGSSFQWDPLGYREAAMQLKRILYPVELTTPTHHGLTAAAELAGRSGAELLLAHAIDFPYPYMSQVAISFDVESYYEEMEAAVRKRLDDLIARLGPALTTRIVILRGSPAARIVELAEQESVDLIVMPTHARRGFERLLVGSVTEKVARMSEIPVLTIPPTDAPGDEFRLQKILFPTDFSDPADSALDEALDVAMEFDADVVMLHVVTIGDQDPANPDWSFPAIPEEYVDHVEQAAAAQLEARGAATPDRVTVSTCLVRGFDPAYEIARVAAEENADLIVMATHGHTGLMRALLGSTAGKVIRIAERPVLTIRAEID